MRVPNIIRDCAAFVYLEDKYGNLQPSGTAFFVSVPSDSIALTRHIYLVTAKHLLERSKVQLRYNGKDGKWHPINLPNANAPGWCFHKDGSVDIAALLLNETSRWLPDAEFKAIPVAIFHTEVIELNERLGVGIGDELIVTGLLTDRPGEGRNIPIARGGIVSAMYVDALVDIYEKQKQSEPYIAHLVELRSTGGLSGSPVFVVLGPARMDTVSEPEDEPWIATGGIGMISIWLLGLIRGHWYTKDDSDETVSSNAMFDSEREGINHGIAKVIPAQYLWEMLMDDPKTIAARKKRDSKRPRSSFSSLDSGLSNEERFTRDDFENALRRVSGRRAKSSEPEQSSSET